MGNPLVHAPGGSRRLGERRLALCGAYSRNFPDPALRPWQGVTCPRCLARRMREPAQASPTESLVSVFGPFDSCPEATSPCKPCYGVGFEPSSIDIRQPVCKACDGTGTAPVTPQASPTGAEGAAFWKSLHEIAICCLRTLLVNLEVDGADDLIAHGAGPETYREIGRKIAQRPLWDGEEQKEIGVYKHRIRELERQNRGPQAGSEGVGEALDLEEIKDALNIAMSKWKSYYDSAEGDELLEDARTGEGGLYRRCQESLAALSQPSPPTQSPVDVRDAINDIEASLKDGAGADGSAHRKSKAFSSLSTLRRALTQPSPCDREADTWPAGVTFTRDEILPFAELLSEFQSAHGESSGHDDDGCDLCNKYDAMNWDLFLPPSANPPGESDPKEKIC